MSKAMAARTTARSTDKIALIAASSAVAVSIGSFLVEFLPHTFFIDKYKKLLQLHKFSDEVPLDPKVENLFDEVLDDLKINMTIRTRFEPFVVSGFDVGQAGAPTGRFKAIIGIPINYTYKDKSLIDTSDIRIGYEKQELNIYDPSTDVLLDSLILSDKAKKFGIAREILMSMKELPTFRSIESPVIFTITLFGTEFTRKKLRITSKPITCMMYAATSLFSFAVWFQIRDTLTTTFEKSVDRQLAELGPDYVQGGKEFYDKEMKKNIALRNLLGEYGPKKFNRNGDEIFLIRNKKTPVSYRKKFFDDIQMQENQQQAE